MPLIPWLTRGPAYHYSGSSLGSTFLHAIVRAVAWFMVRGLFDFFGLPLVLVGAVVVGTVVWLRNRRVARQNGER